LGAGFPEVAVGLTGSLQSANREFGVPGEKWAQTGQKRAQTDVNRVKTGRKLGAKWVEIG
jgi:hypothetical protein